MGRARAVLPGRRGGDRQRPLPHRPLARAGQDPHARGGRRLLARAVAATARARFGASPRVLAAVAGYAVVSELVQALLLARRSGDPLDVVADLLGAALGWWLAGRLLPR